jgi:adenylyltransferase/sulfurtransferase
MTTENQGGPGRYARQIQFENIGPEGQGKISASKVLLVGCGALGSTIADLLTRAGIGHLRIVDRDIIELHNLQRQTLFSEDDVRKRLPKAVAAQNRLRSVNSEIEIEGTAADFNYASGPALADGFDIILDGTDNFETRFLLNDLAIDRRMPWVYGGAVGADGIVKAVIPGRTSCLRCLMDSVPSPGETPTCETAGILASTAVIVASLQVSLALRILTGVEENGDMYIVNAWLPQVRRISSSRLDDCPACVRGNHSYLAGDIAGSATLLCGRDTVQVLPVRKGNLKLDELAGKLSGLGTVADRRYYLEFDDGSLVLSIFPDGRCLVRGTEDPARARAAVSRYLGG